MFSTFAATAPSAMASRVRSASTVGRWPVKAPGGAAEAGAAAVDGGGGAAGDLQDHAGQEQPEAGPERDRLPAGLRREVAGVVGGVGVPAARVAGRRAGGQQEPAGPAAVGGG